MKHALVSVFMVLVIALSAVGFIGLSQTSQAQSTPVAQQDAIVKCTNKIVGTSIQLTCSAAGVVVLNQNIKLPTVEVTLPGQTVTVPVPGPTKTVSVPGPTVTVPVPGSTQTMTIPGGTSTQTITPPPETVTQTVTRGPRQDTTTPATIEPDPGNGEGREVTPRITLNNIQVAALGFFTVLLLAFLILIGMYAGYYLGYKDGDNEEATFIRSLLGK